MLNRLFGGVAKALGLKILTGWVREVAEGKRGEKAQAIYWALAGAKTWSGIVLAVAAAITAASGQAEVGGWIAAGAGVLISLGLVDRAWRTDIPAVLAQSSVYRLLAKYSGELAALLSAALLAIEGGSCPGWTCATWSVIVISLGAALVQLGLIDAAWRASKPDAR